MILVSISDTSKLEEDISVIEQIGLDATLLYLENQHRDTVLSPENYLSHPNTSQKTPLSRLFIVSSNHFIPYPSALMPSPPPYSHPPQQPTFQQPNTSPQTSLPTPSSPPAPPVPAPQAYPKVPQDPSSTSPRQNCRMPTRDSHPCLRNSDTGRRGHRNSFPRIHRRRGPVQRGIRVCYLFR